MALEKTSAKPKLIETSDINKISKSPGQEIIADDGRFYYDSTLNTRHNLTGSKYQTKHGSVLYPGDTIRTGFSTGKSITLVTDTIHGVFTSATISGTSYEFNRSTQFDPLDNVHEVGNRSGNFIDTIAKLSSPQVTLVTTDNKKVEATVTKINKDTNDTNSYYNDEAIANVASVKLSWSGADFAPNKISYAIISGYIVSQVTGVGPQESDVYWDGYSINFQPRRDANENYTFPNDVYSRNKKLIGMSDLVYNFDSTISTFDALRRAIDLTYGLITLSETGGDYYYRYYSDFISWDNKFTITTAQTGVGSNGNATYSQELVLPVSVDDIDISRPLEIYSSSSSVAKKATISKTEYYIGYGHIFFISDYDGVAINPESNTIPSSTKYIKIPLKYRPTSYSGHVSFSNSSNELQLPSKLLIGKRTSRFGYPIFEEIVEPEAIDVLSEDSTKPVQSKAVVKYIKNNLSTVYRIKGTITYSSLNSIREPQVGDVYNIYNSQEYPLQISSTTAGQAMLREIKTVQLSTTNCSLYDSNLVNIFDKYDLPNYMWSSVKIKGSNNTTYSVMLHFYNHVGTLPNGLPTGVTAGTYTVTGTDASYYFFDKPNTGTGESYYGWLRNGDNVVWTGLYWDKLSASVDLTPYAKKSDISTMFTLVGNLTNYKITSSLQIGHVYNNMVEFSDSNQYLHVQVASNTGSTYSNGDMAVEAIADVIATDIKIVTLTKAASTQFLKKMGLTTSNFSSKSPVNMPSLFFAIYDSNAVSNTASKATCYGEVAYKTYSNNKISFAVQFSSTTPNMPTTYPTSSYKWRIINLRYKAIKEGVAGNYIAKGDNLYWNGWEFDDLAGIVDTSNFVTKDELSGEIGSIVTDQTYKPTSSNAQSGKAVKEAVDAAVSSVYKMKGSGYQFTLDSLVNNKTVSVGDTYNVMEDGHLIGDDSNYTADDCIYATLNAVSGDNYRALTYYSHDKSSVVGGSEEGTVSSIGDLVHLCIPGVEDKQLTLMQTSIFCEVLTSEVANKYGLTIVPSDYATFAEAEAAMNAAITEESNRYWQVVGIERLSFAKAGDNVVWNGKKWDVLSSYIDLSGYQKSLTYVNNLGTSDLSDPNAIVNAANTKSYIDGKISDAVTSNGTIVNISGTGQATKFGSLSVTESTASKADFGTITLPGVAYHLLAYTDKAATVTVTCETGSFTYTASAGKIADIEILEDGVARVTPAIAHNTVTYTGTGGITSISFANSATSAVASFKADVYGWKVVEANGASNEISALLKAIYDEQEYYKSLGTVNNVQYATPRYENKSDLPSIDTVGNLATVYGDQDLNNRGCYIFLNGVWFKLATETGSIMNNDTVEVTVE